MTPEELEDTAREAQRAAECEKAEREVQAWRKLHKRIFQQAKEIEELREAKAFYYEEAATEFSHRCGLQGQIESLKAALILDRAYILCEFCNRENIMLGENDEITFRNNPCEKHIKMATDQLKRELPEVDW